MKYYTLFLFFVALNSYAQDNFIQGTITKNDNSMIVGEINYQDWKKMPNEIEFRVGSTVAVFKPQDIKAFEVENDKFISRLVTIDVTEQKLQKLNKTTEIKFEDKTVFLNVLAEGDVNLYEYYDNRTHYFAENDSHFMELINRITIGDNNSDIYENKKYIGQLRVFLNACPSVKVKSSLDYKRKELAALVNAYNICLSSKNDKAVYSKNLQAKTSYFYVTGGISFSSLTLSSPANTIQYFEGSQCVSPNLGLAYEFAFTKNRQKWSLYSELLYSSFKSTETSEESNSFRSYNPLKMDFKTVDLSLLFRYKFNKDNQVVTPFLNLGLGRSFVVSQNNTITENDLFDPSRTKDIPFEINSANFVFSVGGGADYKKLGFEIRYTVSDKLTKEVSDSSNTLSNLRLLVSYRLK
ncbi:porin family protein [Lacinutrix sp. Hel_I_90]|uniref:porin family protein n=1 Tax=Lacinutrix sp. Hel_I_90 TaxID=1249999 RepID=UPI0005C837E7|nr:porin family protein [Lacinutrix sp. Hel_I_90]